MGWLGSRRLDASANRLSTCRQVFGDLTALGNLNLSQNRLVSLPESIGNLTALTSSTSAATGWSVAGVDREPHRPHRASPAAQRAQARCRSRSGTSSRSPALPAEQPAQRAAGVNREPHRPDRACLENNQLSSLPETLSSIPGLAQVLVSDNPLSPEIEAANDSGREGLMAFLKEVATDGALVREAKLPARR